MTCAFSPSQLHRGFLLCATFTMLSPLRSTQPWSHQTKFWPLTTNNGSAELSVKLLFFPACLWFQKSTCQATTTGFLLAHFQIGAASICKGQTDKDKNEMMFARTEYRQESDCSAISHFLLRVLPKGLYTSKNLVTFPLVHYLTCSLSLSLSLILSMFAVASWTWLKHSPMYYCIILCTGTFSIGTYKLIKFLRRI